MTPISKRKRNRRKRTGRLEALKQKLRSDGILAGRKIVFEPGGEEKMSEVLLAFVEPYQHLTTSYEAYQRLIGVAVIAWNAALLPADGRRELIAEAGKAITDKGTRRDLMAILDELIKRKERFFPDNKRFIVSYELSEAKEGYHLSVASTL